MTAEPRTPCGVVCGVPKAAHYAMEHEWRPVLPVPACDALRAALELIFAADRMTNRKKPLAMRAALDEARRVYLATLQEGETP